MKRIVLLVTAALLMTNSLQARNYGRSHGPVAYHGHGGYYGNWFIPFVFGGALGYAASRPVIMYDTAPAVIYTTAPRTMVIDNSAAYPVVQEVTPAQESPVYEERWVYFDDCKCERKVLVNIQH